MATTPHRIGRISLLLHISDLGGGGAERQFSILAEHLDRDRFDPHACLWRPVTRYALPEDIPISFLRKTRPWHVFPLVLGLRRLIRTKKPDLVYSQLHYVNMVTGTALAGLSTPPRWICRMSNDPRREMRGPFATWARRAVQRADRIVCCSRGVARQTEDYLKVDSSRIVQLDNLADVPYIDRLAAEEMPIPRRDGIFVIVHAGRLHHQKNQSLLLRAFSRLKDLEAELWILGEGELENKLRSEAARLGISDRVRWLGFRSNPYPFFRAADCFLLTSDFEGSPNVLIEAMICGLPVVSTRCPFGPDEIVSDGVTGILVGPRDEVGIARAITDIAKGSGHLMGEEGRKNAVRRFGLDRTLHGFEGLFEEVVSKPGKTSPCSDYQAGEGGTTGWRSLK